MTQILDRFRGSLLGLAIGDAMGAPVEFKSPGTFKPVTTFQGGGNFGLNRGEWTDDTSLALCLAESLVECGGFSLADQLKRYRDWYLEGHLSCTGFCFDIGSTTRKALDAFESTGKTDCGQKYPGSASNGSLMRLAPVPLAFSKNPVQAIELSGESSKATHALTVCADACRYFGALIVGAVQGTSKEALLSPMFSPVKQYWDESPLVKEISDVANGSFRMKQPPEIRGGGYVKDSLEAALWAFASTDNFHDGCLAAVNLGDDADTTGAIYGQLAGVYYGIGGIPDEWVNGLAKQDLITGFADRLYELHEKIELQ